MLIKLAIALLVTAMIANVVVSCRREDRFLSQCLADGRKHYECEYMMGVIR